MVEFAVPGQPLQTVQMAEGSWPPAYAVGDPVTILYDPQNARIKSFSSTLLLWLLPAITGLVGVAFAAATLFVFKFRSPNNNAMATPTP